jgi:hypothetical protein
MRRTHHCLNKQSMLPRHIDWVHPGHPPPGAHVLPPGAHVLPTPVLTVKGVTNVALAPKLEAIVWRKGEDFFARSLALFETLRNFRLPRSSGENSHWSRVADMSDVLNAAKNQEWAKVMKLVREGGQDLDIQDKNGYTALHYAAAALGCLATVRALIHAGASLDIQDMNGWTALHHAVNAGHLPKVCALIHAGASLDIQTKDGRYTPLHWAAYYGNADAAAALLGAGADAYIKDKYADTAEQSAQSKGRSGAYTAALEQAKPLRSATKELAAIECNAALRALVADVKAKNLAASSVDLLRIVRVPVRLELFITVMLARERHWHADTAADACTELAAALATLPSLTLALVADAVAALGGADA